MQLFTTKIPAAGANYVLFTVMSKTAARASCQRQAIICGNYSNSSIVLSSMPTDFVGPHIRYSLPNRCTILPLYSDDYEKKLAMYYMHISWLYISIRMVWTAIFLNMSPLDISLCYFLSKIIVCG